MNEHNLDKKSVNKYNDNFLNNIILESVIESKTKYLLSRYCFGNKKLPIKKTL